VSTPPSFLNIVDFFGTFLPGYVAVTLYFALFYPSFFSTTDQFQLVSAIIFLIAGPSIGMATRMFHRYILSFLLILTLGWKEYKQINTETAETRLSAPSNKLAELDRAESMYDFTASTGLVLLIIGIYYSTNNLGIVVDSFIQTGISIMTVIMFIGAAIEYFAYLNPTYDAI
jgi:hypothetical protein